jgi:hypothetical protein
VFREPISQRVALLPVEPSSAKRTGSLRARFTHRTAASEWLARWAERGWRREEWIISGRRPDYQGDALRWMNAWAFGPPVVRRPHAWVLSASHLWRASTCASRRGVGSSSEGRRPGCRSRSPPHRFFPSVPSAQRANRSPGTWRQIAKDSERAPPESPLAGRRAVHGPFRRRRS